MNRSIGRRILVLLAASATAGTALIAQAQTKGPAKPDTARGQPEYRRDLEELSSYAANIKQERPMVLFLSKYLYLRDHKLALEQDGHDLVVDGTSIDFKFHYDFDISHKLQRELTNHAGSIHRIWKAANAGKLSWTWTVVPGIYKDVWVKSPDIFVWVICARDLSGMNDDDLNRICLGSWQRKYKYVQAL